MEFGKPIECCVPQCHRPMHKVEKGKPYCYAHIPRVLKTKIEKYSGKSQRGIKGNYQNDYDE